tara:strand:+ start:9029 stop:9742 length:714 start_codon:yes stop_codon:yes gene_type:complete
MQAVINKKIEKRLKWLDPTNSDLIVQVAKYISDHPFDFAVNRGASLGNSNHSFQDIVDAFIESAKHYEDDAYLREYCRNMKAAWLSWDKRNKNAKYPKFHESSYSISIKARAELERLAKGRTKKSLSSVIDTLLLNAVSIKALQKRLNKILNETNYGIRLNSDFLSTFFSDEKVREQTKLTAQTLKQEFDLKEKKLNKKNCELINEVATLKDEITQLKEENSKLKISEEAARKKLDI